MHFGLFDEFTYEYWITCQVIQHIPPFELYIGIPILISVCNAHTSVTAAVIEMYSLIWIIVHEYPCRYLNVFHMLLIIPILFHLNNRRELLKYLFNAVGIPGNCNNETALVYSKWNTFDEDIYE